MTSLSELIAVAKGDQPADLILANARVVNVFTGEIDSGNVAIYRDMIAGIGEYKQAKETLDMGGRFVAPGLIDGHTHLESSMLDVVQYAQAVVSHGTLALITDLHEIANVCGLAGIKYVMNCARRLPFELFLMAPSCVPATHLETAGANVGADEIKKLLRWKGCIGLGEMMNFPGVINNFPPVLEKLNLAQDKVVDGHAPGVSGNNLNAYIAAGIRSDHESVSLKEAEDKLKRGMYVMIREGSSEKNLDALLPLVTDKTYKRCFFVVDDRSCADLLNDGDIDAVVRKAISRGLDPVRAIQMATINTAEYFRLHRLGAVAPGYLANLIVFKDLAEVRADLVFHRGNLVVIDGKPMFAPSPAAGKGLTRTVDIKSFGIESLQLKASGKTEPVIQVVPGQIITKGTTEAVRIESGFVQIDVDRDILKLVVVERHKASGNIGIGLVNGFGLKHGALASSVAHDSHNIVAVGTDDADIFIAIKEIEKMQGGLAVVSNGKVLGSLALPVAGLLSREPLKTVAAKVEKLENLAKELGTKLTAPFATLSFVALPVIPELRLTDLGMVDVNAFKLIK